MIIISHFYYYVVFLYHRLSYYSTRGIKVLCQPRRGMTLCILLFDYQCVDGVDCLTY